MMTHWKIIRGGGLALLLALFASGCSTAPRDYTVECSAAVCGSEVRGYDNGGVLVLSPNGMRTAFSPGAVLTDSPFPANPFPVRSVRDGRVGDRSAGDPNRLILAGGEYSLGEPATGDPAAGEIGERFDIFCTNGLDCRGTAYTYGYSTYFRFPDSILTEDDSIVTGGYAVIKTTLSNEFLAFGVGASMAHQTLVQTGVQRYRPVQYGSFVFGSRFPAADLPNSGMAAYAGFAQAYAQSSNLNYLPFRDFDSDTGGNIVGGFSAMVFSFSDDGAKFEHGFINLAGILAFTDSGRDEVRSRGTGTPMSAANLTLSANYANPGYRSTAYAEYVGSEDPSTFTRANDFVDNPHREYDIVDGAVDFSKESELVFRLEGNDETTGEMLDFTMQLATISAQSCESDANVICYASDRSDAARAGIARFYGPTVDLVSDSNNADNVPTFAGGVWQYEGIVYVDLGDDGTPGGTGVDEDTLLGVIDLYGSLGGLIVDNPAE